MSNENFEETKRINLSNPGEAAPISAAHDQVVSQPIPVPPPLETQPNEDSPEPVKRIKPKRGKWILLGILGMLIITALGSGVGYAYAIRARQAEELNQVLIAATTQYELGLVDQQQGRLTTARERFEYVLKVYPEFPGISEKLIEVGLAIAQNQPQAPTPLPDSTPMAEVTPIPTVDTGSVKILLSQAEAQLAAQDWAGLYDTVNEIRFINPRFEPIKVDGLYYLALRNHGITQIQAGNLEPGLYDFALAEEIAPLDRDAEGYRTWASLYLNAGSYWTINWFTAVEKFAYLFPQIPHLVDSSGISVTRRYAYALAGYGESLQQLFQYCEAVPYFEQAVTIYNDETLPQKLAQAQQYCAEPPPTPTPTIDPKITPTVNEDE